MASSAAREWSANYEALKRRINHARISSAAFPAEDKAHAVSTLKALDEQLKTMAASPLQFEIAASELARRQVLVENLKKFVGGGSSSERLQLTASSGSVSPMHTQASTYNPVTTSDKALVQRQQEVIKLQDDMLLDIEKGVDRLHQQALQIGDETKSQVHLLDDLDNNVDIATAALQAEAKHAERIKDKAQMCWMYICVAVEVIVLFLLIIILFTM